MHRELAVTVLCRPYKQPEKEVFSSNFIRVERKAQLSEGICRRLHNCSEEGPGLSIELSNHSFLLLPSSPPQTQRGQDCICVRMGFLRSLQMPMIS